MSLTRRERQAADKHQQWLQTTVGQLWRLKNRCTVLVQLHTVRHAVHRNALVHLVAEHCGVTYPPTPPGELPIARPTLIEVHLRFELPSGDCDPWLAPLPRPLTDEVRHALEPLANDEPVIAQLLASSAELFWPNRPN